MHQRILSILSRALLSIWLMGHFPALGQEALRLGVFPIRPSYNLESEWATPIFFQTLTEAIIQDMEEENIGQVVLLPWPEALSGDSHPNFETLIAKGMEAGCNGVLVAKLEKLDFSVTEKKLPVVGWIKLANTDIRLKGGLLDVRTAAAVSPLEAKGKASSKNYKGPGPDEIKDEPIQSPTVESSLLGKALAELRHNLLNTMRGGKEKLTPGRIEVPNRPDAPVGVGFVHGAYTLEVPAGFDRRGIISVVNCGSDPQNFIIKPLEITGGAVVGLKGKGSVDSPCLLGPGEWKSIRLIINSPEHRPPQSIKLGLFAANEGESPDVQGEPQDTALVQLHWTRAPAQVTFSLISQDPATLAYSCSLINQGEAIDNLSLEPAEGQEDLVSLVPDVVDAHIAAGSSLNFQVIPRLVPGFKSMDVTLEGDIGSSQHSWVFHFDVPEGKNIYYGLVHSVKIISSNKSDCTNRGFNITNIRKHHGKDYYTCEGDDDPLAPDVPPFKRFLGFLHSLVFKAMSAAGGSGEFHYSGGNAVDVRGATIRENVSAWLPDLDKDSRYHPMASAGDKWIGFVNYIPDEGGTSVHFVAFKLDGEEYRPPLRLNEKGHAGRWPYLRTLNAGSRAYVVWEDLFQGKTDVAFRSSTEGMTGWGPVVYLTSHGKGINDPILQVAQDGTIVTAWEDLRFSGGRICLRFSRDGGESFTPEVAIPRAEGEVQSWPQVAPTMDGEYALVYASKRDENTSIQMLLLDSSGTPKGKPFVLSHSNNPCGEPQITCGPGGHLFAVWREGEGQDSEVWFARGSDKGSTWTPPKQLTRDDAYSEYPLVGVDGPVLWASYHSNISGVADLKYVMVSQDQGETWGEPVTMPSLKGEVRNAWLEVNFTLKWPRSNYHAHDTYIALNGTRVGAIEDTVPEGTYVFKVPPELVVSSPTEIGFNEVEIQTKGLNHADYIMTTDTRLVVEQRFFQVPVVANSQAEADRLALNSGGGLNHSKPDLVVAANHIHQLPDKLSPGLNTGLNLRIYNLGDGPATKVKIAAYEADPRGPDVQKDKMMLAVKVLSAIAPGSYKDVDLSLKPGMKPPPRVFVGVQCEEADFDYGNNVWGLSFTSGDEGAPSPLLGTDIPNIFYAPGLMDLIHIPDTAALEDLVSLPDFSDLVSLPGLGPPDVGDIKNSLLDHLKKLGIRTPDWLKF
jgi:hypothetical protein